MGKVYLARSPWSENRAVAVKVLHDRTDEGDNFIKRFQHEMQIAVRLRHPNITQALDVGRIKQKFYVASELVIGTDVGKLAVKLCEQQQGAPLPVALWLLVEMLDALHYMHNVEDDNGPLNLIHRDITPRNVLIDYRGIVKLADFGLAKSSLTADDSLTDMGTVLGTPRFLPPESFEALPPDQTLDVYGAGAVVYTLLTGLPPYWGTLQEIMDAIISRPPFPLEQLRPDLPPWVTQLVTNLMARDPSERPKIAGLGAKIIERAQSENLLVHRSQIEEWLQSLFQDDFRKQQTNLQDVFKITESLDEPVTMKRLVRLDPTQVFRPNSSAFDEATIVQTDTNSFRMPDEFHSQQLEAPVVMPSPQWESALGGNHTESAMKILSASIWEGKFLPPQPPQPAAKPVSNVGPFEVPNLPSYDLDSNEFDKTDKNQMVRGLGAAEIEADLPPKPPPTVLIETRRLKLILPLLGAVGMLVIGLVIMWSWPKPTPVTSPEKAALQTRLLYVQTELTQRKENEEEIDPKIWRWSLDATKALFNEDYVTADKILDNLEAELEIHPSPPSKKRAPGTPNNPM